MQMIERQLLESKLEKIGNVFRITGWISRSVQSLGLVLGRSA